MDIKRPAKSKLKKRIRNAGLIAIGVAAIGGITYGLSKMKPAAPTLDRSTTVIGVVKRGEMVREVKGNGTLVPQVTRWIPAPERRMRPRAATSPDAEVYRRLVGDTTKPTPRTSSSRSGVWSRIQPGN